MKGFVSTSYAQPDQKPERLLDLFKNSKNTLKQADSETLVREFTQYCLDLLKAKTGPNPETHRMEAIARDIDQIARRAIQLGEFYHHDNKARQTGGDLPSFKQLKPDDFYKLTRPFILHITAHPTESHAHHYPDEKIPDGVEAIESLNYIILSNKHRSLEDTKEPLTHTLKELYDSFKLPSKRPKTGYKKDTRKLSSAEENTRIINNARKQYDSLGILTERLLDAFTQAHPNVDPFKDDHYQALLGNLMRVVSWIGDKDSKPHNTALEIQKGIYDNEGAVLNWYFDDLVDILAELDLKENGDGASELKEKILNMAAGIYHYLENSNIPGMLEERYKKEQEDTRGPNDIHYQMAKFRLDVIQEIKEKKLEKTYHNAKSFMDDLHTAAQEAQQNKLLWRPEKGPNSLHQLWVKAKTFGNVATRIEIRQNATIHSKSFGLLRHILSLKFKEDQITDLSPEALLTYITQNADKVTPFIRALTDHIQEVRLTPEERRQMKKEEITAESLKHKKQQLNNKAPEIVALLERIEKEKIGEKYGFEAGTAEGAATDPEGMFYDTLASCMVATDNPRSIKGYIIAHAFAENPAHAADDVLMLRCILAATTDMQKKEKHRIIGSVPIIPLEEELVTLLGPDDNPTGQSLGARCFETLLKNTDYARGVVEWSAPSPSWKIKDPDMNKETVKAAFKKQIEEKFGAQAPIVTDQLLKIDSLIEKGYRPMTIKEAKEKMGFHAKGGDEQRYLLGSVKHMMAGSDLGRGFSTFVHPLRQIAHQEEALAILDQGFLSKAFLGKGSATYRRTPELGYLDATHQGKAATDGTPETIACDAEQAHCLDQQRHHKKHDLKRDQGHFTSRMRKNIGNILRYPENTQDLSPELIKRIKTRLQAACNLYAPRMSEEPGQAQWEKQVPYYNDYIAHCSAHPFVSAFSYSNRPDAVVVNKKPGETGNVTPPPPVVAGKLRAIGHNANLMLAGGCNSMWEGMDASKVNVKEFLDEIRAFAPLQDLLARVSFGLAMTDINTAWKWTGTTRPSDQAVKEWAGYFKEGKDIKTLPEPLQKNPGLCFMAHTEMEFRVTLPLFYELNYALKRDEKGRKNLTPEAFRELCEKDLAEASMKFRDILPKRLRAEVTTAREGVNGTGGLNQSRAALADLHSAWLDTPHDKRASFVENHQETQGHHHNCFAFFENAPAAFTAPLREMEKTQTR